jgi:hypothetical protein
LTSPVVVLDRPETRSEIPAPILAVAVSHTPFLSLAALTPAILLLHGYHPFADDAGIYTAGIRKLADPSLYRPDAAYVLAHTRLSIFAHMLAVIVRTTQAPLDFLLLLTYLASIFLFLFACWSLSRRIFSSPVARWCAVATAGACFSLPIAGSSIVLMDPYLTARSFSTPLGLLALAAAIDRAWTKTVLLLIAATLMHPLMTFYAGAFLLLFVLVDRQMQRTAVAVSSLGVCAAGILYAVLLHHPVSPAYRQAILSRSYLYPLQWGWIELVGLIVPLLLYTVAAWRLGPETLIGKLSTAGALFGVSSALAALLFVHPSGPYLLVRLQMLRSLHTLFALLLLVAGGLLGELVFNHSRWVAFALLAAAATGMWFGQRAAYSLSAHVELPGRAARNPWQQAFLWIRANTPRDAIFAANPHLVYVEGEDTQGFRATSERSLLADDKDEGVVVVFPELANAWAVERNAQADLDRLSDAERIARVRPFGASWLLLSAQAETALPCPYSNAVAQVCRIEP